MSNIDYDALSNALAEAITAQAQLDDPEVDDDARKQAAKVHEAAWTRVPAGVRVFAAYIWLQMNGDKPSINKAAKVSRPFSRGSFADDETWEPLRKALTDHPQAVVSLFGGLITDDEKQEIKASAALQQANEDKAALRAENERLKASVAPLERAVQELHGALLEETGKADATPFAPPLRSV